MAFTPSNPLSGLSVEDERYLHQQLSPQSRPMDLFSVKAADPLPDNWTYDSAIDLFSLNPADMDPVAFDFADSVPSADAKDLFLDPFAPSNAISGFSMPTDDAVSLSSDIDSDDQSWSGAGQPVDLTSPEPVSTKASKPTTRKSESHIHATTRWSSPDITPRQAATSRAGKASSVAERKTRSFSQESTRSSTSQDPQMRNAAKRAAHNIIEKRYRTNMNAKFLALEQAITPGAHKQISRAGAGSLKKSEILTNALAYIEGIQQDNLALQKELALLKQNLLPGGMWRAQKPSRG